MTVALLFQGGGDIRPGGDGWGGGDIRPGGDGWVGGQGRITLILSPPDLANVAYRPCHFRKQSASRFEAIAVTSACLFRVTPDELVDALRSAISARWAGRDDHGTPVAWRTDRART